MPFITHHPTKCWESLLQEILLSCKILGNEECRYIWGLLYYSLICFVVPPTLLFDGAQYVLVTLPEESLTEAEDISVRFRTIRANGILVLMASSRSTDTLEIYLEHGAVKLTISLGSGSKVSIQVIEGLPLHFIKEIYFLHTR